MTQTGTNTYILGRGAVAVIDPGPAIDTHLEAILAALAPGETVSHILITHSHLDHSPLARDLAARTGAPICAFGHAGAGRSQVMRDLAARTQIGGGEGVDHEFSPDITLTDGQMIKGRTWSTKALWTPGHFGNHLCFISGDRVFTGDHVMGWASSLVSPPDGDLTDFMASCRKLEKVPARIYYPGHGAPVTDPQDRLAWLIAHRQSREAQILAQLSQGPATPAALTQALYRDTPPALWPAAERNVLAHLIDLLGRAEVHNTEPLGPNTRFSRRKPA